jgi:DNA topoisomerase-1
LPGIRRRRAGRGFVYTNAAGRRIRRRSELERIRRLAIPPAWIDVWISPFPNAHILATGRDARGRKQYRYHPKWRVVRDGAKFDRLIAFGEALPDLRRRIRKDMARTGLPRERVVATIVALLDCCFARIGNEEYARSNSSFGLTTLRDRHARVEGSRLRLRYRGKGGKGHDAEIDDPRIVHIVKRCREIPGQELFQYLDNNEVSQSVGSGDVNDYLRGVTGLDASAKDFRTWAATVAACAELAPAEPGATETERQAQVLEAIDTVAEQLGNTRAVCRKSYVHPDIVEGFLDGSLARSWAQRNVSGRSRGLRADERVALAFLRGRARRASKARAA